MKPTPHLERAAKIPSGESFIQLTQELLNSPAWRVQSINCRKVVEKIIIEHLSHAEQENGKLITTYNQFEEYGISRNKINSALQEAEALGLIWVEWGPYRGGSKNNMTKFTLTFCASCYVEEPDKRFYIAATNDWQKITEEEAKKIACSFDGRKIKN